MTTQIYMYSIVKKTLPSIACIMLGISERVHEPLHADRREVASGQHSEMSGATYIGALALSIITARREVARG